MSTNLLVQAIWRQVDNMRIMYAAAPVPEEREFLKKTMIELLELLPGLDDDSNVVICPRCANDTNADDITTFKGQVMCEGCAETSDLLDHDDPHGKNWRQDNG